MKHKIYLTEKEFNTSEVKKVLMSLFDLKRKINKHLDHIEVTETEYLLIKDKSMFVKVKEYAPKKKDRIKNEIGKYYSQRMVLVK